MILGYVTNLENYEKLLPRMDVYQEHISKLHELPVGRYELGEGEFFSIQEGTTRPLEGAQFEFHEQYIDLQIMLEGSEQMKWQHLDQVEKLKFDQDSDIGFATGEGTLMDIQAGMFYLVYPHDAHMPGLYVAEENYFKKAVFKLKS